MTAVGQCRARCAACERVLPHHVVRRTRVARFARFSLFTMQTRHALVCACCHSQTLFARPRPAPGLTLVTPLVLIAPLVLLLAALA